MCDGPKIKLLCKIQNPSVSSRMQTNAKKYIKMQKRKHIKRLEKFINNHSWL